MGCTSFNPTHNNGDHIALTFDGDGNQTERFLHGLQIDEVLAQENAGGEVLWALADHQGSVKMLLDNDGNVVNNITYDAFGNITVETNPDINFRFSYTGRELDPETGLYNYRTRYLDPKTHQFISPDTIGFAGGDSNLYRYVFNSPLKYRDPDGKFALTIPVAIGAAVALAGIAYLLNQSVQQLVEDLGKLNPNFDPFPPPQKDPKKEEPKFPPLTDQDDADDLLDKFKDWADKMKEKFDDHNEENERKEEENNRDNNDSDSCGINDRPDYLDDIVDSNEPQNNSDNQPQGNSNSGEEESENIGNAWDDVPDDEWGFGSEEDYDPRPTTPGGRTLSDHAALDSLDRHRFSEPYDDVDAVIDNPTYVTQQRDGADVYIQAQEKNRYNMAVVNSENNTVVTAIKDINRQELRNLGKRYGFKAP